MSRCFPYHPPSGFKGEYSHKRKHEEELEGSCVTEEPLNLSCSSESTQNSNKRRKQVPFDKKILKRNSQYAYLIQNLYQMALPPELVDNDEEWLFRGKPSDKVLIKSNVEKQFAVSSEITCSGSSVQFPCARYLQEAKMFALPYTVPF